LAWTQEQLVERLGVSTRYVQSVEAGRENLTLDTLCKFAATLRTTFGAIVLDDGSQPDRAARAPKSK